MTHNMGPWNLNGNVSSFREGYNYPAPTTARESQVRVAMQTCFDGQVHKALVSFPSVSDAKRLCSGWFCSATRSLTLQTAANSPYRWGDIVARRHTFFFNRRYPSWRGDASPACPALLPSAVSAPSPAKGRDWQKSKLILTRGNCGACRNGPRSRPTARTWAIYRHKALIDGD